MTILEKIIAHKQLEVAERKAAVPAEMLEASEHFNRPVFSLAGALDKSDAFGIIAEFKRRSPSKGAINENASIEEITKGYVATGASALSILTDSDFFGGSSEDLMKARLVNSRPILRKDFIVDEYQIVEARSIGADVILLIAAALDEKRIAELATFAASLGLEVLLEIHTREEIPASLENINVIGVNNRDLHDFSTDPMRSIELAKHLPEGITKISESGLDNAETIIKLRDAGFNGFLIGEAFMRENDPAAACADLINDLRAYA